MNNKYYAETIVMKINGKIKGSFLIKCLIKINIETTAVCSQHFIYQFPAWQEDCGSFK